jgi:hypothetical protein
VALKFKHGDQYWLHHPEVQTSVQVCQHDGRWIEILVLDEGAPQGSKWIVHMHDRQSSAYSEARAGTLVDAQREARRQIGCPVPVNARQAHYAGAAA